MLLTLLSQVTDQGNLMVVIESSISQNQETLHKNIQKMSSPDAIFELKMHTNAFAARALLWTSLGKPYCTH